MSGMAPSLDGLRPCRRPGLPADVQAQEVEPAVVPQAVEVGLGQPPLLEVDVGPDDRLPPPTPAPAPPGARGCGAPRGARGRAAPPPPPGGRRPPRTRPPPERPPAGRRRRFRGRRRS